MVHTPLPALSLLLLLLLHLPPTPTSALPALPSDVSEERFRVTLAERMALDKSRAEPAPAPHTVRRVTRAFKKWYRAGLRRGRTPAYWEDPVHAVESFCLRRMITGCSWTEVRHKRAKKGLLASVLLVV
jgi:hypothetical protein